MSTVTPIDVCVLPVLFPSLIYPLKVPKMFSNDSVIFPRRSKATLTSACCADWRSFVSHPGGLNVILKQAASCQNAAATEAFRITLLFTWLMRSNVGADYSSFRKTTGKIFALKLDQSVMYVQELNKNEPGKSCNNSWPT